MALQGMTRNYFAEILAMRLVMGYSDQIWHARQRVRLPTPLPAPAQLYIAKS
jgi:hypothetical protein